MKIGYAPIMMKGAWRLLLDPPLPGLRNMARDLALLESTVRNETLTTLRFYSWSPPCLSLGRHQDAATAADLKFCRRHGIEVLRRPTGGRAVLHHLELTYSFVSTLGQDLMPTKIQDCYALICKVIVRAFRDMGIDAETRDGVFNRQLPRPSSSIPCFMAAAGGEIHVGGRKLVGSAMRVRQNCMLQHGSILLDWDTHMQAGAMGARDAAALEASIITLRELLGRRPEPAETARKIASAFEAEFDIVFRESGLSGMERESEEELRRDIEIIDEKEGS